MTFLLIITAAILVSFWQVPKSIFDADQEYFALSSRSILQGDLTLIGQQTGIGELYHAPGFNYLVALGMWFSHGNPFTIAVIGAIFSTVTVVALYVLGSQITSARAAIFAVILALTSDQFLGLASFAQNISPLTLLTLLFLWIQTCQPFQQFNRLKLLLSGLIVGLTLHFHILGAMLIVPLFIWSISQQRRTGQNPKDAKLATSIPRLSWILPFLLMASPLFLFDIRNDWLIVRHAVRFVTTAPETSTTLWYRIHTYLVSLADLIHVSLPSTAWVIPTVVIIAWGLWNRKIHRLIKVTLVTPFVAFLLFRGHLVPYYAIVAWAPFVLISGALLSTLWEKSLLWRVIIVIYVGLLSRETMHQLQTWDPLRTIDKKLAAIRYIKQHADGKTIHISRTMELSTNFGFDYLLWNEDLTSSGNLNDPNYTLVVPANFDGITPDVQFGDIGVVLPQ